MNNSAGRELAVILILWRRHVTGKKCLNDRIISRINRWNRIFAPKPITKINIGAARRAKGPFCSSRCADVDLGNWFRGKYAIPAVDSADDTIIEALLAGDMAAPQDEDDR